jgi:hypothetical protein
VKEKLEKLWSLVHVSNAEVRRAGDPESAAEIRAHSIKRDIELAARAL